MAKINIKDNLFLRNAILAVCVLVLLIFLAQIFLSVVTRHGQVKEVPDFNGLTVAQAHQVADKMSLKLEVNDSLYRPALTKGVVLEQNPAPGAKVKSGRRIFVTINAFSPRNAFIPFVSGYSLRKAKTDLEIAGFGIDKLIYREDIATNNVLEQRYNGKVVTAASNIEAPVGSSVSLVVGISPDAEAPRIPKVVGFPLKEAKSRLWEIGFNIGKITNDEGITEVNLNEARVYRQSPNAGSRSRLGSSIDLHITLDEGKIETGSKEADRVITNILEVESVEVENAE